ncbi:UNVERIFIED_CONTAM: hypothetical protein Slati_3156000 [Sesamum latifolium]|uniref:Tf2-1-like SH3-like domain-containing protein n=1 Tax=Sesamum latifolium TaxID=2727402 RepID=A0AAW2V1L8_9LAMI
MQEKVKVMQLLKENLHQAQQRMKLYADKKRTEREFQVGDEVLERIGKVAYILALPPSSKIHPVFHVSLLKKKIGSKYFPSVSLPDFEDEVFKVYPATILARRLIPRNNVGVPQVLIQWSHGSPDQATWEDYKDTIAKFPDFDPWGQGSKKGGRDVMSSSRNTSLYGKCAIEEVNMDRQINGRFELGVSKENAAVLTEAKKNLALPNSNATFTPDRSIKVKSISHPIEGKIELGIEAAHSKACDVVTCELGHDLLEGKFRGCDVGINSTNGQAPRHVEGEERV